MLNLLKMEFYKLRRSVLFYGIIILTAMENPVIFALSNVYKKDTGKQVLISQFAQQQYLMFLVFIGILAYLIVNEFDSGYIKNLISCGHKRVDIVISKSIMYYTAVIAAGIVFPLTGCIMYTAVNGYGESFSAASLLYILKFIFLILLIYIAMASIEVFVAFVTRSGAFTLAICLSLDAVSRTLSALAMRSKAVDAVYSKTIYAQCMTIASDNKSEIQTVIICLITIAVSTLLSIYFFKKADIK